LKSEEKIWILEDDAEALLVYQEILSFRYHLRFFETLRKLEDALSTLNKNPKELDGPSLLVADLWLPDGNFLDFLGDEKVTTLLSSPFFVVSSCDDIDVLRACFEEGALDYLTKPFTRTELIVKIERIFRKNVSQKIQDKQEPKALDPQDHVIFSPEQFSLKRGDDIVTQLTPKELQIFSILHRARGNKVSRSEIQEQVWNTISVTPKAFDVHLFNLRKKLSRVNMQVQFLAPDGYLLSSNRMD
jgi:DNA-binding response OmpR family regulator